MIKDRLKHYNPIMWAVEIQNPDILKVRSKIKTSSVSTVLCLCFICTVTACACVPKKASGCVEGC